MLVFQNEDDFILKISTADFPSNYVNFIHPEDYKLYNSPFMEMFFHKKRFHNRIFIRLCFKLDIETYLPLTFIIDTGCPMYLYLCTKSKDILKHIINSDEFGTEYISLPNGKKFTVDETPLVHENVNIIGLMAMDYLGFSILNGEFIFENIPDHF